MRERINIPGLRQIQIENTRKLFKSCIKPSLKIKEKITVSQWAERCRILDETSNFKGLWSNDMTPYLKGIMDAFNDNYIQEINFVKSTQVGGTETMLNILGYIISQSPAQTLLVYPTDDLAKEVSKTRIKQSLLKTPDVKKAYNERESKELQLKFKGMTLYLTGAGNPAKLSSKSVKYLFIDEIDKLGGATKKEASPYNLAKERTRTYTYSKKIFTTSTPTIKENYVWTLHEEAEEQRCYFVRCPHCQTEFIFDFHSIVFDDSKELTKEEKAKTAVYVCKECGCMIEDADKPAMLRNGVWKATKKSTSAHPKRISFWINALYSRFVTWEEIILEFLKSKDNPEELQNFVNSWLAEPWEDTKLRTNENIVLERQTELPAFTVPEWAKMITGGVDVQENCLYWTVTAFGDYIKSQNIAHGQALNFNKIGDVMNLDYKKENGEVMQVQLALIDSGDQTDEVYEFCASNADWAYPCKGASQKMHAHYKISKINKPENKAHGMNLVLIDTGRYKDMIATRMQRKTYEKGSWSVYKDCDTEYAIQVTAEHKINVKVGGKVEQKWVKKKTHGDNHYLDAEVYATCAADMCGVRTLHLEHEEQEEKTEEPEKTTEIEEEWIGNNEDWL